MNVGNKNDFLADEALRYVAAINFVEREIEILKGSIEEAKQSLRSVPAQKLKDEVFWTTAITESELEKFVRSIYG